MKSVVLKVLGGIAVLLLCLVGFVRLSYVYGPWKDTAVSTTPSASDILNKVAIHYEESQSYKDEGEMRNWFISVPLIFRTWIDFKTAFNRPSQFRFEYRESGLPEKAYVVWRQNSEVKTWWWIDDRREKFDELSGAIAAATGVSGGTSRNIPALLLLPKEIKGRNLTRAAAAYRISDGTYQGTPCYRIQTVGQNPGEKYNDFTQPPSKYITTYWIGQETFTVLKIEEVTSFPWLMVRALTTYSPYFNQTLPPELFTFGY